MCSPRFCIYRHSTRHCNNGHWSHKLGTWSTGILTRNVFWSLRGQVDVVPPLGTRNFVDYGLVDALLMLYCSHHASSVDMSLFGPRWRQLRAVPTRVCVVFGHFWPFLAIFWPFWTKKFSKCEKRAMCFSVRIFGTKKIFWDAPNNDFASFFFLPTLWLGGPLSTPTLCGGSPVSSPDGAGMD